MMPLNQDPKTAMQTLYLNGGFVPAAEASIPVLDRGFIFGDGVYEVIPVFNGKLFRLAEHLARLANSLRGVMIDAPLSDAEWQRVLNDLIERNRETAGNVYLQVTRGVAPRDLIPSTAPRPTVMAMVMADKRGSPEPVKAAIIEDIRWQRCDLKVITLLPNVLMKLQAQQQGADDAILARGDTVTEASSSNVFAVVDDQILTPRQTQHLLPGVTRDLVVELMAGTTHPVRVTELRVADLRRASEIFLSSSGREIVPVVELDGQPVGNGAPGPVWGEVLQHYRRFRDAY